MTISVAYPTKQRSTPKLNELTILQRKQLLDIIRQKSPENWDKFKSCTFWKEAKLLLENFLVENLDGDEL